MSELSNRNSQTEPHSNRRKYLAYCGWLVLCIAVVVSASFFENEDSNLRALHRIRSDNDTQATSSGRLADANLSADVLSPRADSIPIVDSNQEKVETTAFTVEQPKGRVLIVRGIMTVFSLGMNDIGKALQKRGYDVRVTTAAGSYSEANKLRNRVLRANDGAPVIIMGHSLGADRAPQLATLLGESNVQVELMVMLDSTMPNSPPANVKRCVNFYQSGSAANIFNGKRIKPASSKTEVLNINIASLVDRKKMANINHFNVDTNPFIQQMLVDTVAYGPQLIATNRLEQHLRSLAQSTGRKSSNGPSVQINLSDNTINRSTDRRR